MVFIISHTRPYRKTAAPSWAQPFLLIIFAAAASFRGFFSRAYRGRSGNEMKKTPVSPSGRCRSPARQRRGEYDNRTQGRAVIKHFGCLFLSFQGKNIKSFPRTEPTHVVDSMYRYWITHRTVSCATVLLSLSNKCIFSSRIMFFYYHF